MEVDPIELQKKKDALDRARSSLLLKARLMELEGKIIEIDLSRASILKEMEKVKIAIDKADGTIPS